MMGALKVVVCLLTLLFALQDFPKVNGMNPRGQSLVKIAYVTFVILKSHDFFCDFLKILVILLVIFLCDFSVISL